MSGEQDSLARAAEEAEVGVTVTALDPCDELDAVANLADGAGAPDLVAVVKNHEALGRPSPVGLDVLNGDNLALDGVATLSQRGGGDHLSSLASGSALSRQPTAQDTDHMRDELVAGDSHAQETVYVGPVGGRGEVLLSLDLGPIDDGGSVLQLAPDCVDVIRMLGVEEVGDTPRGSTLLTVAFTGDLGADVALAIVAQSKGSSNHIEDQVAPGGGGTAVRAAEKFDQILDEAEHRQHRSGVGREEVLQAGATDLLEAARGGLADHVGDLAVAVMAAMTAGSGGIPKGGQILVGQLGVGRALDDRTVTHRGHNGDHFPAAQRDRGNLDLHLRNDNRLNPSLTSGVVLDSLLGGPHLTREPVGEGCETQFRRLAVEGGGFFGEPGGVRDLEKLLSHVDNIHRLGWDATRKLQFV